MRTALLLASLTLVARVLAAQAASSDEAWRLEVGGQAGRAQAMLQRAAAASTAPASAVRAYAEFLDRYRDPAARQEYARLADLLDRAQAPATERAGVYRRLIGLDLAAGDRAAAQRRLTAFTNAGGTGLALPPAATPQAQAQDFIEIPGPLTSFARMAALAPDVAPEDFLPGLARNVVLNGYQAVGTDVLEETEYLKLVVRYLSQAREMQTLAGPSKTIQIQTCDSTTTADLLRILGYRMRGGCGADVVLETLNASRAFLTIDSGFPLAQLEQALRDNRPFTLDYHPARVPVLYGTAYWQSAKDKSQEGDFIDYFLADPSLCRLYLALSKLDPETAGELRKQTPAPRLKVYAHVLDFFGGMFEVRDGKAIVPGGARAEKAWADLVGGPTDKGGAFFEKLIVRDDGWLASYYDALARINGPVQDYLTDPDRLKRFYSAIRGRVTTPGPARPVFRANTDMLLLTARLRLDADGKPHIPGGVEVWKNLFANYPRGKFDARLSKAAPGWKDADDVLEALFGLSRKLVENEPLKVFMALSDMERGRPRPLAAATVDRLAREYRDLGSQYTLFSEVPSVTNATILAFLDMARGTSQIRDAGVRADAIGAVQGLAGLWQIFSRQDSIAAADQDQTLAGLIAPFSKIQNEREVFDAGLAGVRLLLKATHSPANVSAQDRIVDLLSGTGSPSAADNGTHQQMIQDLIGLFEAQRLVSLTTLIDLADNLDSVGRGEKLNTALAGRLATRITEIQLPHSSINGEEKSALASGYWTERHVDVQRKINLRAAIDKAANDPQKLKEIRGQLAPFLRDTLVGFNYIHYAPPGEEVLRTNPLFVRSHDFIGLSGQSPWRSTEVLGTGWPANAGGRLVGSLAELPYALAEAEQNFLVPDKQQALIWEYMVPQMVISAVVPRWWNVTPLQMHWVGVHLAYAEALLEDSAVDPARRTRVENALDRYAAPGRLQKVHQLLLQGDSREAIENVSPGEMYRLAEELAPSDNASPLAASIRKMAPENPQALSPQTISRAFGTPKPTLANSFEPELLNLRTFPPVMGYSSRIMAESWESSVLFYASLADRIHATPAQMNLLVPEWTRHTVEGIFATHLEDWPAVLRSLRQLGQQVLEDARKQTVLAAN